MEIKYLKPHNGKSVGDTEHVEEDLGKYLILMGVAEVNDKHKYKGKHK